MQTPKIAPSHSDQPPKSDVQSRLLKAAAELFLDKDYHRDSIREIAKQADTTSAMINYYFKSKNGLYEATVKDQYNLILQQILDLIAQTDGMKIEDFIAGMQNMYANNPKFANFEMLSFRKSDAFSHQYLKYIFEFERAFVDRKIKTLIADKVIREDVDIEVVRILCYCVTLFPGYIRDTLKDFYGEEEFEHFLKRFAATVGNMISDHIRHPEQQEEPAYFDYVI